jgi:hypothetical protein
MNTKVDFKAFDSNIVYVKSVAVADLPEDLRDQAGDRTTIFSVHKADGAPVALVADRALAFTLARQHDMQPVTVH